MHKQDHQMVRLITLMYILICNGRSPLAGSSLELTAIHSSRYAFQLYRKTRNEDRPSTQDLALWGASIRDHICENITGSEFFSRINLHSAGPSRIFVDRSDPEYQRILNQDYYSPRSRFNPRNAYRRLQFTVKSEIFGLREFLFQCYLQYANISFPVYVSKEYNVDPYAGRPSMPGRFVFWDFFVRPIFRHRDSNFEMILAEEPGVVRPPSDFNIEFHYLQTRKYMNIAESNEVDPLCRLVSERVQDPNNQHIRICVAVFSSSHFKGQVSYPFEKSDSCQLRKISFTTTEGISEAAGEDFYYERLTPCSTNYLTEIHERKKTTLFISRAYRSDQILVYRQDKVDNKIYLLNLVTNVNILDELNSFDFVEY